MELNIRQRKAINANEDKILCLATAAAGKTRTLTERVKRLVNEGCSPNKIACITFTNLAADEMKKRLGNISNGMYIGTIHGLANKICLNNGIITQEYICESDFDMLLKKVLTVSPSKMPYFEHVLVDEFQDICPLEFRFLEVLPKKNIYLTGDERQMIYGFRGTTDRYIRSLYLDIDYTKYYLNQNYRNAPNIIEYADDLITTLDKISPQSIPVKTKKGFIKECSFYEALEELMWDQDWGNWFILCRTNDELAVAAQMLEEHKVPFITFKKGDIEAAELNLFMTENKVKLLTIHTSKGLENKKVIVVGARTFSEEERRIAYVAATRAENELFECPTICGRRSKNRKSLYKGRNEIQRAATEMISFE